MGCFVRYILASVLLRAPPLKFTSLLCSLSPPFASSCQALPRSIPASLRPLLAYSIPQPSLPQPSLPQPSLSSSTPTRSLTSSLSPSPCSLPPSPCSLPISSTVCFQSCQLSAVSSYFLYLPGCCRSMSV